MLISHSWSTTRFVRPWKYMYNSVETSNNVPVVLFSSNNRCRHFAVPLKSDKKQLSNLEKDWKTYLWCIGALNRFSSRFSSTAHTAVAGFCSMKRLGVFLLSPEWDASPSQGYITALNSPVPIYTAGWREAALRISKDWDGFSLNLRCQSIRLIAEITRP